MNPLAPHRAFDRGASRSRKRTSGLLNAPSGASGARCFDHPAPPTIDHPATSLGRGVANRTRPLAIFWKTESGIAPRGFQKNDKFDQREFRYGGYQNSPRIVRSRHTRTARSNSAHASGGSVRPQVGRYRLGHEISAVRAGGAGCIRRRVLLCGDAFSLCRCRTLPPATAIISYLKPACGDLIAVANVRW
jgi:hypothetical protein